MEDIAKLVPEKHRGWILFLLAVSPYITRALHSLTAGGGIKGALSAIWLGTNTPKEGGGPKVPPAATTLLVGLLALGVTSCGTLAPSGVYGGDKTLYAADLTITTSYDVMHTFVQWEYKNRDSLKQYPEVKKYADVVRAGAKKWIGTAVALRDAYAASPTKEKGAALEIALNVLRESTTQASMYLLKGIN
jgi:hypothetical protein